MPEEPVKSRLKKLLCLPSRPSRGLPPQSTPEALPSPILSRMSSTRRYTTRRRAARRSGGLPRRVWGA